MPESVEPTLSINSCPGTATITGAPSNGPVALARGAAGSTLLGGSGCVGLEMGLGSITKVGTGLANGSGEISFPVTVCGTSYQAMDYLNCSGSNTVTVP